MMDDRLVSVEELVTWFGDVSPSAVGQMAARGVIVKEARGRYPLKASVPAYCNHMRAIASGRGEDTPAAARGRLARAQAEIAEAKARRLSGELAEAEAVKYAWVAVLSGVKASDAAPSL